MLVSVSSLICIFHSLSLLGNHQGEILLFSVPQKGTNIFLKETIPGKQQTHFQCIENKRLLFILGHQHGIASLVSNDEFLVSSDTTGMILIWNIRTMLQVNNIQPVDNSGIISMVLWKTCLAAGYANGMIRFFDVVNGK